LLAIVLCTSVAELPSACGQVQHFESAIADYLDPACQPWDWQILPAGLLWHSYLAGPKEPRLGYAWLYDTYSQNWVNDSTIGARVGLLRFGTRDPFEPQGWELDVEAAAFPRLQQQHLQLNAVDFRVGVPFTWRGGPWQTKLAYYHVSSHVGDEYLLANPGFQRINYRRDAIVLGAGFFAAPDMRLYAEVGYAFVTDGGAEPWELQFGWEFAPTRPTGLGGAPFIAMNGYLREEVDWGGDFTLMAGWAWRGDRLLRVGLQYTVGESLPWEFLGDSEQLIGVGLWYDF
jgi:hypothetical protein